mmetsp:Transcript_23642/g.41900  ORF Transcript_23642/g.41900 Transcript_23642/m.41900 type:complete len:318 (-) Transcript_23642:273-1226(-)|eukprot:CAMPEP_0204913736 /NCGR_PEP_ID=MMETSP1397-20131031/11579_1 /ASSEMBLY_ACC=CAM_ASM_000891 /TAXON_ID=49980 /ORGANISM="Climacostomum Climacostomum virens, Strain Stock W-24" /LENGTH=317 /DNA_ID=CAMNT_0052085037 /DNA_START=236 /DNA_END=1189 /DNA_ORIENTATION=+
MDALDELGFFEDEPEWITANRNRFAETPELRCQKFHPSYLDGWVTLDTDSPPLPDLISGEEPMELEQLFTLPKRSILEKMDIEGLLSYETLESYKSSPASSVSRKYWNADEEDVLRRFIALYPEAKAIPKEAWEALARTLGRSVCSIHSKAAQLKRSKDKPRTSRRKTQALSFGELIKRALITLPGQVGTKAEIISVLQSMSPEAAADSRFKTSVSEAISRYCTKMPGRFKLVPGVVSKPAELCDSMVDFIICVLSGSEGLTLCELKYRIEIQFSRWLNGQVNADSNLCVWEKTLLKKLRACPWIDRSQADARYRLA